MNSRAMSKCRLLFLFLLVTPGIIIAQQYPVLDEYRINPGILAPSFTGTTSLFQVYLTQRNDWTGIPGSPVTGAVNIEGIPYQNMGIGTNILVNKAGMVSNNFRILIPRPLLRILRCKIPISEL